MKIPEEIRVALRDAKKRHCVSDPEGAFRFLHHAVKLLCDELEKADQPAPTETGPVDIGGGMKLYQATDPRYRLPPEVLALLTQSEPAPTETGPQLDTSLMTEEGRRAWEAAPLAEAEPAPQGAQGCKWCGKALCDCPRPQGAPRIVQSVLSDCHYCDKRELDDDWKCPHCDQHYTINRVELATGEVVK